MNTFPFGSILKKVEQKDRSPKKVFILGVYASAVHAKWINPSGRTIVKALAVASEPYIFWRGDQSDKIIKSIQIPEDLGRLEAAEKRFNGPSGLELDKSYLQPLGLTRDDVWLCDIIPFTRINAGQKKAIDREYNPLIEQYKLPICTIPGFDKKELDNESRRKTILKELESSEAKVLILLGDLPIKYFLSYYSEEKMSYLSNYGLEIGDYGKPTLTAINGKKYQVIPLVHPRQAGKLGHYDEEWNNLHQEWIKEKAPALKDFIRLRYRKSILR